MRIAHLSDLHLLGEGHVPAWRYLNKRLTGVANLRLRRHAVHKPRIAQLLARELRTLDVDHVVITGDLTNLALEREFEAARRLIDDELQLGPDRVSVIPGNHDVYTRGAVRTQRFASYFGAFTTSDLPDFGIATPAGVFPFVRLRGPAAIIGLSSAVPRPPLIAAGYLGRAQRDALERLLSHPEVRSRLPVVLIHHPPHNPPSFSRTLTNGLWDAPRLRALLNVSPRVLVLHGHLHTRTRSMLTTGAAIGATSASLLHDDDDRRAGFNVYDISDAGDASPAMGFVINSETGSIAAREIPTRELTAIAANHG